MGQLTPLNPFVIPITMGRQSTASQDVYEQSQTTWLMPLVPRRVLSLQHDLDRPHEVPRFGPTGRVPLQPPCVPLSPDTDEPEDIVRHTERVVTVEQSSKEWLAMTRAADAGVQLPDNLED